MGVQPADSGDDAHSSYQPIVRPDRLVDLTPLTLGYEGDGLILPVFERNTPISAERVVLFRSMSAPQSSIAVHLLQGARPFAADCRGFVDLILAIAEAKDLISAAAASLHIDDMGILHVDAKDESTGHTLVVEGANVNGLSDNQAKDLLAGGEDHLEDDRRRLAELLG